MKNPNGPSIEEREQAAEALLDKSAKHYRRTVFGRVKKAVDVGISSGRRAPDGTVYSAPYEPLLVAYIFELKQDGLHVRRRGTARKRELVIPFNRLINLAQKQPNLL